MQYTKVLNLAYKEDSKELEMQQALLAKTWDVLLSFSLKVHLKSCLPITP